MENFQIQNQIQNLPQGTILGPFLFILYINDIFNSSKSLKFLLYADDTTLYFSDKDLSHCFRIFNQELLNIDVWSRSNRISLNLKKTKYMILSNKIQNISINDELKMSIIVIERVNCFKVLGVYIDDKLRFDHHVETITSKLSRTLGTFKRLNFLPINILRTLYFSFTVRRKGS